MSNTLTTRVSGKVSSRGWAVAVGIGAIVLATILLVVYLDRYRDRVGSANTPTPVLVAKQAIPAGTPGNVVTQNNMYAPTEYARKDVLEGALADPTYLEGRAASRTILPGQQITIADFAASTTTTVDSQLTGTQRAFSVSIDTIHSSVAQLSPGDFVDIYISVAGTVRLFKPNVQVLTVPTVEGGGNIMLKIDTKEAARFLFAADNAQFWFVIRPAAGAKPTVRTAANAATVTR